MKTIHFTHFDCDGAGCAIIVYNFLFNKHNWTQKPTVYNRLNKDLSKLKEEKLCNVIITDLNLSLEQLDYVCKMQNVNKLLYIDHHPQQFDIEEEKLLKERYSDKLVYISNQEKSASKLTYEYLLKSKPELSYLSSLIELIDIYDMWRTESPYFKSSAYPLNNLFWYYGYEKFFERCKLGLDITDEDIEICKRISREREEYIKNSILHHSHCIDNKILIIMNPETAHTNYFTISEPNYDFYLILKSMKNDLVDFSIRINSSNDYILDNITKLLQNEWTKDIIIGGHDKAGGVTIHSDYVQEFVELFVKIVDKLYK